MSRRDEFIQIARTVPFDNTTAGATGMTSTEVQAAIEEIKNSIATSASPGFTYGRSGNLPANTWLLNDTVPCNKSGRINFLSSASIVKIFIANELPDIIKIGIYSHDGNEINLTLLGTVTTAAQNSNTFTVAFAVALGKQIAVKIEGDTASGGKNMDVGLQLKGTI